MLDIFFGKFDFLLPKCLFEMIQFIWFFHFMHQNFDCFIYGLSDSCICALEHLEDFFNLKLNKTTEELLIISLICIYQEHFQANREFERLVQWTLMYLSCGFKQLLTFCCVCFIYLEVEMEYLNYTPHDVVPQNI